jgi:hypothetical protein
MTLNIDPERRTINLKTHLNQSSLCMQAIYDARIPNGSFIVYMSNDLQMPGAVIKTKAGEIRAISDLRKRYDRNFVDEVTCKAVRYIEWFEDHIEAKYHEYKLVIDQEKADAEFDVSLKNALKAASRLLQGRPFIKAPSNTEVGNLLKKWQESKNGKRVQPYDWSPHRHHRSPNLYHLFEIILVAFFCIWYKKQVVHRKMQNAGNEV